MEKAASYSSAFRTEAITFESNLAIIGISTHGVIIKDRPIIPMPRGIDVAKMNFVMPTVCSFLGYEDVQRCNDTIIQEINMTPGLLRQDVYNMCVELTEKIKHILLSSIRDVRDYLKSTSLATILDEGELTEEEAKQYINRQHAFKYGEDRAINIFSTTRGVTHMVNKSFIRTVSKDLSNPHGDWQMKLLNHRDQPDLIPDVYKFLGQMYTRGESEITLEQLLLFLISKGIKKVIIFDYSCSNVTDDGREDIATDEKGRRIMARKAQIALDLSRGTLGYGGKGRSQMRPLTPSTPPFRKRTTKKHKKKLIKKHKRKTTRSNI